MGASPEILSLLISVAIGYLLGAIPLADRVSRRKGIDIFSIGTGLAGATNVRRNVGPKSAAVVVLGDAVKGMIAILAAKQMGIEGPWLFVPATATVVGHWNSIFTRFKGGDGLVVLGGICLVVFSPFPVGNLIAVLAVLVGIAVALGGQKLPYTSLLCIFSGYGIVIVLTYLMNPGEMNTVLAIGTLALIVFGHAVLGHARRNRSEESDDFTADGQAIENQDGLA
ncbi:MAG: hypothetical protein F4X94_01800 [Dehalococcoidia bacterium]|nr:hypothetical protein [Dehalococcoidia bacterium]